MQAEHVPLQHKAAWSAKVAQTCHELLELRDSYPKMLSNSYELHIRCIDEFSQFREKITKLARRADVEINASL